MNIIFTRLYWEVILLTNASFSVINFPCYTKEYKKHNDYISINLVERQGFKQLTLKYKKYSNLLTNYIV